MYEELLEMLRFKIEKPFPSNLPRNLFEELPIVEKEMLEQSISFVILYWILEKFYFFLIFVSH